MTPKHTPATPLPQHESLMGSTPFQTLSAECEHLHKVNALLLSACEGAQTAVEDYIARISKAGFQPSFGSGVLREIKAAIAKAKEK